jgi:hypothetical protein
MRGSSSHYLIALSSAFLAANVYGGDAVPSDIVLTEPVRIAFLEAAPRVVVGSMREAVRAHCAGIRAGDEAVEAEWLCRADSLRYLREVDVLGSRYKTGVVCSAEAVTPNLRYFTPDMFEDEERCVYVSYNASSQKHAVDLGAKAPPNKSFERTREK